MKYCQSTVTAVVLVYEINEGKTIVFPFETFVYPYLQLKKKKNFKKCSVYSLKKNCFEVYTTSGGSYNRKVL